MILALVLLLAPQQSLAVSARCGAYPAPWWPPSGQLWCRVSAGDTVADAGIAYRLAQTEIEAGKYEEAIRLLQTAVQLLGDESDQIRYRDDVCRRRHAYYPYYEWGRARMLQSSQDPSTQNQRDFLVQSIGRLGQTRHPNAPALLKEATSKLEAVKNAIALEGTFAASKTRIEVLGSGDRFEEAFKQGEAAIAKYPGRKKELEEVRTTLKEKQTAAIKRYEQMLTQRLSDVVLMDPATVGDRITLLLRPALVPADVTQRPGPWFQWASRFIELWERLQEMMPRAAELPGDEVIRSAEALDAIALDALNLNLPTGFRASRHLSRAWRNAKLRDIVLGNEDVLDTKTAEAVTRSALAAAKQAGEAASRQEKTVKDTLLVELATQENQVHDLAKRIDAGAKERERMTAPILRSEELLADGDTTGDRKALEKLRNDLSELQSDAGFGTLTPRLRARAFFAHGISEAVLAFLEGKTLEQATERARLTMWRAFGLDRKIDERWAARVSPKIVKVFDAIRPQ